MDILFFHHHHHLFGTTSLAATISAPPWGGGGQRVQGRNMLNHSNILAKEICCNRIGCRVVTLRSPWSLPQMMRWTGLGLARTRQLKIY